MGEPEQRKMGNITKRKEGFSRHIGLYCPLQAVIDKPLQYFKFVHAIFRCSSILQRLTLPRMIDQFGRKMCQMKRKDVSYQLLLEFFQKYFVVHERWPDSSLEIIFSHAIIDDFSKYLRTCRRVFLSCPFSRPKTQLLSYIFPFTTSRHCAD